MEPRKFEWMHVFDELVAKHFPNAAAGLWLDVLNRKLYWVDPPEKPIRSPGWTEGLTENVDQALSAAGEFLGQAAAKLRCLALEPDVDPWDVGPVALERIRRGCVEIIRTRHGSSRGARAKAVVEALGDPDLELIKGELTADELTQLRRDLKGAKG